MIYANFETWPFFTVVFTLLLLVTFIMMKQGRQFYTKDPVIRKFSIMELEMPATPKELVNLIEGLYKLPAPGSARTIAALKGQLKLNFLFMPLAYGSIFLLSWRVANKMQLHFGYYVFISFAFLQIVPWICDLIENIYLLGKIRKGVQESSGKMHRQYLWMEATKWGIALTGGVCCISAICYFWLTGSYSETALRYLLIFLAEIIIFLLAVKFSK